MANRSPVHRSLRRSSSSIAGARPGSGFYYSPAWRKLRKAALIRDGYRCQVCGRNVSGKGMARVDHIKPVRTAPHLALSLANLRSLCPLHDNQGHREKPRGSGAARVENFVIGGCDARGVPLDPGHHWKRQN
jgi:5-methylcytosine-specific restriction endonuclease McrA